MKALKYLFALLLSSMMINAEAQEKYFSVLGKVVDSATGQPLAGASAFCPSTTYGTVSNTDGNFYLRLPYGGYDLNISYTGYQKQSIRLSQTTQLPDTMVINLVKQENTLGEVAVVASNEVPDGFSKYGQFFLDNFIGTTENAKSCTLKNPDALRFFYRKKTNTLKVLVKEDLEVQNLALGYNIRIALDSFNYDYKNSIYQFTALTFFQEIDSTDEVKEQWKKNRARTYLGSRLHFMRSFYDSTLEEEGFVIEKLEEGDKAEKITSLYDSMQVERDSSVVNVLWDGKYRVSYKRVLPDPNFLKQFKLPSNTRAQPTLLLVNGGFVIEQNGYFYDQYDVLANGYWSWKAISEALPYDYLYE
jgi:hypothetical protein